MGKARAIVTFMFDKSDRLKAINRFYREQNSSNFNDNLSVKGGEHVKFTNVYSMYMGFSLQTKCILSLSLTILGQIKH